MTTSRVLPTHVPDSHLLHLAVAGYLTRFKGISRTHAESASARNTATACSGPRQGGKAAGRQDQAIDDRTEGPIILDRRGKRMERHAATRRLRHLAEQTRMRMPPLHPHMLRRTYVTTMPDAGVDLRDANALLAKTAEMPQPDRTPTERIHAIITFRRAGALTQDLVRMPAYAKDGKIVCFFQPHRSSTPGTQRSASTTPQTSRP